MSIVNLIFLQLVNLYGPCDNFYLGTIAEVTGFSGEIRWVMTKPNGPPRRKLNMSRTQAMFDLEVKRPFAAGLRASVE